ncbi:putative Embryo-specific protein 3 [Cinnamomum micranthum f. kanehirae]|uniref:Putative Embryo-specific protein 3 n=1 Tax=Cinnamomum micranthum f. kanehirae TaxID=337451 RepID=A0A3S3LWR3_9MAGN|nr:putative Embryo-specific protein 3 [Cinnamomum micranthum f. kanehirae]
MEMKRSRALIFCASLLFVLVGLGSGQPESTEKQANCTYTVLIETTCSKGAGTSDRVSLRFGDSKSNDILLPHLSAKRGRRVDWRGAVVLTDVPQKPFKACGIDQFQVIGSCVESPICYLFFKHRGNDRWRPGLAQVLVPEISHFSSKSFYFRRFLPQHVWHGSDACDTEVTPFGIKHTRKIFGGEYMLES